MISSKIVPTKIKIPVAKPTRQQKKKKTPNDDHRNFGSRHFVPLVTADPSCSSGILQSPCGKTLAEPIRGRIGLRPKYLFMVVKWVHSPVDLMTCVIMFIHVRIFLHNCDLLIYGSDWLSHALSVLFHWSLMSAHHQTGTGESQRPLTNQ